MTVEGYEVIGPLSYRGKVGCESVVCTRSNLPGEAESCFGWHCAYCDEPCSYQGHQCDASEAILGEAKRIAGAT